MEMSDTPETDHLENELGSAAKFSHPVIWKHARQLERERDDALSQIAQAECRAERYCQERDEVKDLAQQMSESNQVLQAEVRDYRKKER